MADIERILNGAFPTDLTHWDDKDSGAQATSLWAEGFMVLLVNDHVGHTAAREQVVTVQSGALCSVTFDASRSGTSATLNFTVGSTSGASDVFSASYTTSTQATESFTPDFTTLYFRLSLPGGIGTRFWLIDNVSMCQPNPDANEFPKNVITL